MNRSTSPRTLQILKAAALTLVLGLAASAVAQALPPGFDLALQPEYTRGDVLLMEHELLLSQPQRDAVLGLLEQYNASFKAGVKSMQQRIAQAGAPPQSQDSGLSRERELLEREIAALMEQIRDARMGGEGSDVGQEQAIRDKASELRRKVEQLKQQTPGSDRTAEVTEAMAMELEVWAAERKRLHDHFAAGLAGILDDQQRAKWPAIERRSYRERAISRGRLSAESVNLVAVVDSLELDDQSRQLLDEPLEAYGERLDRAMRDRDAYILASLRPLMAAIRTKSAELGVPVLSRQVDLHQAVRAVNLEFAATLPDRLPEQARPVFDERWSNRAFPKVYRNVAGQRLLKAALEATGEDPGMHEAVLALERDAMAELAVLNEQYRQALIQGEPDELTRTLGERLFRPDIEPGQQRSSLQEQPPWQDHVARRQAWERRLRENLKAMLPADLQAELVDAGHMAVDAADAPVPDTP